MYCNIDLKKKKRRRLRQSERERKSGAETSNGSNPSSPSGTPECKDLIQRAQTKERDGPTVGGLWETSTIRESQQNKQAEHGRWRYLSQRTILNNKISSLTLKSFNNSQRKLPDQ